MTQITKDYKEISNIQEYIDFKKKYGFQAYEYEINFGINHLSKSDIVPNIPNIPDELQDLII